MKRLVLAMCVIGAAATTALYVGRAKNPNIANTPDLATPSASSGEGAGEPASADPKPPRREHSEPATAGVSESIPTSRAAAPGAQWLDASLVTQAVDTLVSPQATHAQRQAVWKQLREAGRLDAAIAELERRVPTEPRSAEYPAALGQAYLQKCGTIQDVREQGVLALQADKLFDTALNLDPANWEARFTKAVALSYWPASMNKGEEVLQHFQTLIEQQETQSPQPHFAESYAWLGDQYLKAGQNDDARAIWKRGATLFPNNEKLSQKLASAQ